MRLNLSEMVDALKKIVISPFLLLFMYTTSPKQRWFYVDGRVASSKTLHKFFVDVDWF